MAIYVSALTGGANNFQTTSEHINGPLTDLVSAGVVGAITNTSGIAPMTGAFAVNAQGTPNMTTAVTAGTAYVTATPTGQSSQVLRIRMDANQNVTHAANSTGGTRYDWIYIKVDPTNAANPNPAGDNVGSLVVSRSTSSSTDDGTPPTYGHNIAVVTVANGASSITNGNIADKRAKAGTIIPANSIKFVDLLSTIFSGQVTTYTNPAAAGGTFYHINLGGIKLLWGKTNAVTTNTTSTSATLTLPVGFFTTIQGVIPAANDMVSNADQYVNIASSNTTTVSFYIVRTAAVNGSAKVSVLVIGT